MSRGCLWRPRPPPPATRDWVSSPALGILAVLGESAGQGLGPISSSLALALPPGLSPWEQGRGSPHPGQMPSQRGLLVPPLQMRSQLGPTSGPLLLLCRLPGARSPALPGLHCGSFSGRSVSPPQTGLPDLPGESSSHPCRPPAPQLNSSSPVSLSGILLLILFPVDFLPYSWHIPHSSYSLLCPQCLAWF